MQMRRGDISFNSFSEEQKSLHAETKSWKPPSENQQEEQKSNKKVIPGNWNLAETHRRACIFYPPKSNNQ